MKQQRAFLIFVTAITAVAILLIFSDGLPLLRGPAPDTAVWSWPYDLRPVTRWGYALAAALFLMTVMGFWLWRGNQGRWWTFTAISALAAGSFFMQFGLIYADNPAPFTELINRTLAVQTNGYFWTAAHIDNLNDTLRHYPDAMAAFESDHARTHPPGLVVANWLTLRAFEQFPTLAQQAVKFVYPARCTDLWLLNEPPATAAALGFWSFLPMLLAAASVFPAYALANKLTNSANAILATGFVAAMPALLLFAPLSDQIFAFLTLCIMLVLHHGLQKSQPAWLFISGLLLSIATFLSVGNAALLVPILVYGLLWRPENGRFPPSRRTRIIWTAVFGMGALTIWLIYWIGWHIPPWQILQASLSQHYGGVTNERSYTTWLLFNLIDLILFSGLPAFAAFGSAVLLATRNSLHKKHPVQALALGTAVLIIVLLISGSTRGEVGRIWLFFAPMIAVSGGLFAASFLQGHWRAQWGLFGLQLALALALGLAWKPVSAVIVTAPNVVNQPIPSYLARDFKPLNIQFGSAIRLTEYAIALANDGRRLDVALTWLATERSYRPYTVYIHLLDADGNLLAQQDGWPLDGQWPPTCWQPGIKLRDQRQIALPNALPGGAYTLKVGLYDAQTGVRLPTDDEQDGVTLTEIFATP